jgi:glutamate decarboxylase
MLSDKKNLDAMSKAAREHTTTYGSRYFTKTVPKYEMPEDGMPARAAYQIIHDELNLDGNPALNLASFVTTWMEPEADLLIMENIGKNYVDNDEYPQTEIIQERVVNILARLFNASDDANSIGSGTIGSSEAIMLGLLAHKWSWKKRREAEGKSTDKPNIVIGADVHTVWEKFALYFDVELKLIPLRKDLCQTSETKVTKVMSNFSCISGLKEDIYTITAEDVAAQVDENTIAVGAVVGTTFTGQMDPIENINAALLEIKESKGWDIPIHVDAASGGFTLPFLHPELKWDFRLEQVRSINVSGHKYGLVYPGIGWLIFKDKTDLPEELIFKINYLGGIMPNYSLNFSKGSSTIIAQYYNLIRLGMNGYKNIMENMEENAHYLASKLNGTNKFEVINKSMRFPIVTVQLKNSDFTVFHLSEKLRQKGWIVPAYTLPADADEVAVLRMVVKESFSKDMVEMLFNDIMESIEKLEQSEEERVEKINKNKNPTLLY